MSSRGFRSLLVSLSLPVCTLAHGVAAGASPAHPHLASAARDAAQDGASQNYDALDHYQTVLRTLREGVQAGNEGVQHASLMAIRALRLPDAQPLYEQLLNGDSWTLRVDGLLGLAELSSPARVDLARLEQLPGERDREAAISAALALNLADAEQVRTMLGWVDLSSSQRVLLAAELRRLGGTPDTATLVRLANSKTPEVSGLAVAILIDMQAKEAEPLEPKVREQIAALPVSTRSAVVAQIAEASTACKLAAAAKFVAALLSLPDLSEDARMRGLGSLLVLSAEDAYPVLDAAVKADSSQSSLVRHASVLLASGVRAPAAQWARFRNGDSMLESIADAGAAIGGGDDAGGFARIVELERRVLMRAALDGARRMGPDAERAFGLACLALVLKPGPTPPALSETLLLSLFRLAETTAEPFRAALATPDLDEPTRDALLMSLANAGTPAAAEIARTVQGRSSRLGEGLIAVLVARHAPTLAKAELDELMRVAGGASNVAFPVRVQAAWLWMKHANKTGDALAALAGGAKRAEETR
ncbi:MAG: hypothetical protein ACOYMM_07160 [Phycisphaerales bacterium]